MAMRSLQFARVGPPEEVIELVGGEEPRPKPGEILVRIRLAPIHPSDLNLISGTYGDKPPLPCVPGGEAYGEVVEVGAEAAGLHEVGDKVAVVRRVGTWRDLVSVTPSAIQPLPVNIDPAQASLLGINPATAWCLLSAFGQLAAGDWLLQNLASSSVGRCVIQLARERGIHTCNVVRNPSLIDDLLALGADSVLEDNGDITPESGGWETTRAAPSLAFNGVGGESALRLMNALRTSGTLVTYGAMAKRPLKVPNGMLIFKDLTLKGFWMTRWFEKIPSEEIKAMYESLAILMAEGRLTQPVAATVPVTEFAEALRLAGAGQSGKTLLRFD